MEEFEQVENRRVQRKGGHIKKFFVMFTFFYTTLTILSKLAVSYGYMANDLMENLTFGVVNAGILSLLYVLFTINEKIKN